MLFTMLLCCTTIGKPRLTHLLTQIGHYRFILLFNLRHILLFVANIYCHGFNECVWGVKKTGRGVSLDSSSPRRELFMDININVQSQVHATALALHPISETHLQRNVALSP